jgi:multiple sugar transport system substrate-binding protein
VGLGTFEGVWKGVPDYFIEFGANYRKDLFDANNLQPVDTWDDLLKSGTVLKQAGNPIGIAINQKSNDANNSWNGLLWSYGASYVAADGKTVAINSPETKEAVRFAVELYKSAMTDEVLSWDDTANNQFLASGVWGIMSWSKNVPAAKAFLTDYYGVYIETVKASEGYNQPLLKNFRKKPMPIIGEDPKLQILQDFDQAARAVGHPGPPTPAAAEVEQNWIIPLMIGQAVQSGNVDEAVNWASGKVEAIYAKYK